MEPGDVLAARVQQYVASQVPPQWVAAVTAAVCRSIATLMNDPTFTNELVLVKNLRQENLWLKQQVLGLTRKLSNASSASGSTTSTGTGRSRKVARPKAPKRPTASRTTTASGNSTPSRRGSSPSSMKAPSTSAARAFQKGFKQARR